MDLLTEICQELKNWFELAVYSNSFTISGGEIQTDKLLDGQYYRICGSVFNDGVHKYGAGGLTDETFNGEIWAMGLPPALVQLSAEIEEWQAKYGATVLAPYNSESFGGYSYSKAAAGSGGGGAAPTWRAMFADRLNRWRKI